MSLALTVTEKPVIRKLEIILDNSAMVSGVKSNPRLLKLRVNLRLKRIYPFNAVPGAGKFLYCVRWYE